VGKARHFRRNDKDTPLGRPGVAGVTPVPGGESPPDRRHGPIGHRGGGDRRGPCERRRGRFLRRWCYGTSMGRRRLPVSPRRFWWKWQPALMY